MPAVAMLHENDPRDAIIKAVGDLSGVEIWKNQVLCGIYERPERTRGGVIVPDVIGGTRDEDKYQGKVALVLKLGPNAFVSDDNWTFTASAEVGDWVFFRTSVSRAITVNGKLCRLINDTDIDGRIDDPDRVW